jgi:hypothetical protein
MHLPSDATIEGSSLIVILLLLTVAVIVKYLVERGREQLRLLGPQSYIYTTRVVESRRRRVAFQIYKHSFHLRPLLALLLIAMPSVAGAGLALSFVAEMYVLFRYHLVLLTAVSALVATIGVSLGIPLIATLDEAAVYSAPGAPFVQVLLAAMYGLSAVRKWKNGFANGRVLEYGIRISLSQRKFKDHIWTSSALLRFADKHFAWPIIAKSVIAGEVIIGCLLILPLYAFNIVGVVCAALAQASFTVLFPRTLLPFTLAVLATLVLWL